MHPPEPLARTFATLLLVTATALGCGTPGTAQDTRPEPTFAPEDLRFDLFIYGADLDAGEHEVFLRTNLDFGGEWESLGSISTHGTGWGTAVVANLSAHRYFGQDFREMYLDLKIATSENADGARIAAIYAVPHVPGIDRHLDRINRLIENDPGTVEAASIASHVQPAPATLRPGAEVVEHVRAPMKHELPGVAEVKQLQVEWRNRGQ
ncbi:MAG: hypothetical protein R3314_00035 [Longimicrobiales bacterium]|nr:hypothetical protein [Longimicrobiales bacterium]